MKKTLLLFSATLISLYVFSQPTWQWGYEGGGPGNDLGYSISTDPSGNSYVTGRFHATASFGANSVSSYGGPDIFVAKYNSLGACIWARHGGSIDGQDPYGDEGDGIDIDAAGNCYATGNFMGQATFGSIVIGSPSSTSRNIFLVKYDSNGNIIWARYPTSSGSNNYSRSVAVDAAGNSYITGYLGGGTNTFGAFALSGAGGFVVKYDANGNVVYATKLGVNGALDLYGIDVDAAGSAYVTGYLQSSETINSQVYTSTGMRDGVVVKLNASGNFSWLIQSHGFASTVCMSHSVCSDAQDGVYWCGEIDNTSIFGTDTLYASMFASEIFLVKCDTAGNFIWATQSVAQSSFSNPSGLSLTSDHDSRIFMTGTLYGDLVFDTYTLVNTGMGSNTYIAVFDDSLGTCTFGISSSGQNPGAIGQGISTDNAGAVYICGYDKAPVIFGQDTTAFIGGEDFFIAKLGSGKPMDVSELSNGTGALVYNASQSLHVVVDAAILSGHSDFILCDMMGRELKKISINAEETIIPVSDLPMGIYCWRMEGKTEAAGKILISE